MAPTKLHFDVKHPFKDGWCQLQYRAAPDKFFVRYRKNKYNDKSGSGKTFRLTGRYKDAVYD